ncbi:glycoside hydrolase family 32 protein [Clostridium saccharoperbutylacetonicum]|uniref:glycoside hydrolase family 32 protein n=1 Tax=Clostridium saccharoperbutylacetonicum TaxID=36745 RepID=UPI000983F6D0|nr:glycoside hydrolase family 32 protein [Clostridium saccharoperbutylacetonicum]AQR94555.1 sucrose-6-phosphate hydrolase [Clostridium saccharoperbutylacetonicum]NSB30391.1 beta-fructofuranosidase [Clostridium saccharoperbutylacetonicum]
MGNIIRSNSKILDKARIFEKEAANNISYKEKPSFHLSAPVGWINDPNGFSMFKGEYHLFYQYHPYDIKWGPMHWGHSKTKDFIKWEQLPTVLAPDEEYDMGGCFSGSAIELDGTHVLMYTGVVDKVEEDGSHFIRQTQCVAIGDGIDYEKLDCNPVIDSFLLPEGSKLEDFRDPKMWKDGDYFYVVVGSRHADESGQILLYKSKDLRNWSFVSVLDRSENKLGRMWECPDFFKLDGSDIMIISPQEVKAKGLKFHNGHNTAYLIGQYDKENYKFNRESYEPIDFGLDFYAPQTLETEDGRRIMIGWMQSWENNIVPSSFKWCGMMTIPRELTMKDGHLIQNPIREIENYYKNTVKYENQLIQNEVNLDGILGREIDMTVEISGTDYEDFTISVAKNNEYETIINFDPKKDLISFDRSYSSKLGDLLHKREIKVRNQNGKIKLRLIIDKYSVEIFVNDGEQVMTSTFYTELDATGISFYAKGNATVSIEKHDIVVE